MVMAFHETGQAPDAGPPNSNRQDERIGALAQGPVEGKSDEVMA
jgi:hypothetical protein